MPWGKPHFLSQLALLEFTVHQRDVPILVELGAAQLQLVAGFDDAAAKTRVVVEEARERRQVAVLQLLRVWLVNPRSAQATPEAFLQ